METRGYLVSERRSLLQQGDFVLGQSSTFGLFAEESVARAFIDELQARHITMLILY